MIVKQSGGMIEFIPSPSEKRDGAIHNHTLELLGNVHRRLERLEQALGMDGELADAFAAVMARITCEEEHILRINEDLLESGLTHPDTPLP